MNVIPSHMLSEIQAFPFPLQLSVNFREFIHSKHNAYLISTCQQGRILVTFSSLLLFFVARWFRVKTLISAVWCCWSPGSNILLIQLLAKASKVFSSEYDSVDNSLYQCSSWSRVSLLCAFSFWLLQAHNSVHSFIRSRCHRRVAPNWVWVSSHCRPHN